MTNDFFRQLMKLCKANDYRDLTRLLFNFSANNDFTFRQNIYKGRKRFFRAFVIAQFYDVYPVATIRDLEAQLGEKLPKKEKDVLTGWFDKLDL